MTTSPMPLRRAGRSGLSLSAIGMGLSGWGEPGPVPTPKVGLEQGFAILDRALELGVTHWDTAAGYTEGNSERLVGKYFASRGRDVRDRVILSTKWWGVRGAGRGDVRKAVDGCLRRLQTDYLDIFMLHNPCYDPVAKEYQAPIDETWGAIDDMVTAGKIHYMGISNAHGINLREANEALSRVAKNPSRRLTVVENGYNLLRGQVGRGMEWARGSTEQAFLSELDKMGIGLIPFWALAAGALSGRYRKSKTDVVANRAKADPKFGAEFLEGRTFDAIEELALFAESRGAGLHDLAVGWLLAKPQIASVLVGVTRMEQLEEAVRSVSVKWSESDLAAAAAIAAKAENVDEFCKRFFKWD